MGEGISIGVYGKHPAWGDFVTGGLSDNAQHVLERWLNTVLPALRDAWGEGWGAWFDASPIIRFWFGAALVGEAGPLCGICVPSRDKVGRRFPLVTAVCGADVPAPVADQDQSLYATMWSCIEGFERPDGAGGGAFADALTQAVAPHVPEASAAQEPAFWAARGDGDLGQLWADVAAVDHQRASAGRSYLWADGPGGAAVHVTRDLPDAGMLGWLMTDAVSAAPDSDVMSDDPDVQDETMTADQSQLME